MPRYTMYTKDSKGRIAPRTFDSPDDAKAKAFANAVAGKSAGKWLRLTKRTSIPATDLVEGVPVYGAFGNAPVAGSSVIVQAKGVYFTTVPKNTVSFTIPAPKTTVVNDKDTTTVVDPLSAGQISHLKSENGAAVTALKQYTYIERPRR